MDRQTDDGQGELVALMKLRVSSQPDGIDRMQLYSIEGTAVQASMYAAGYICLIYSYLLRV